MSASPVEVPDLVARFTDAEDREQVCDFRQAFQIGRGRSCDIRVPGTMVSRFHTAVYHDGANWWVRDLDSVNGTLLNGERVRVGRILHKAQLQLGADGPVVELEVQYKSHTEEPAEEDDADSVTQLSGHVEESTEQLSRRYLEPSSEGEVGEQTAIMRRIVQHVQRKQRRRHAVVISLVGLFLIAAIGAVVYQYLRLETIREHSTEVFYNMKKLEVHVARMEVKARIRMVQSEIEAVVATRAQLKVMEDRYEALLDQIGVFGVGMSEEERLIHHIARIFGESDLNVPPDFVEEIKTYIGKWKQDGRFVKAMLRAQRDGYLDFAAEAFSEHYLPRQFVFVALQESFFDEKAVGPRTRYGIAKGMWQFIPKTAKRYGLELGPLSKKRRYDPKDDRHDFEKATVAAAEYLKDIYSTEAQASGLLVMASYNWGEDKIAALLNQMPENPKGRNFWELLKKYKKEIPNETYDYVLRIFAAAVIAERPRLFGFDFDNPFAKTDV